MKRAFASDAERLLWEQTPEAGWIDAPGGPLFASYYPARAPIRSRAILLCETLGSDRMNLHLAYRHLALCLSANGYPALRFDYPGTGDASGCPRDPGWSELWEPACQAALETLLMRSGLERAALFGARFGGTLAVDIAARCAEVDSLLLWGPFVSGRAFLRDARAMHKLTHVNLAGRVPSFAEPEDEEFRGFLLNAAARERIEGIRPLECEGAPCASARIIAWDEYTHEDKLAAHLSGRGVEVEFDRPAGLRSEDSIVEQALPEIVFEELVGWLDRNTEKQEPSGEAAAPGRVLASTARVRRSARLPGEVEETVVWIGSDRAVFGIRSQLADRREGHPGPRLLLVSGGNNHRSGINRNYTEWARDASLRGFTTLRIDVRGLGDSPPRRWEDLNQLYREQTRADVVAGIDHLAELGDGGRIVVFGLCAGAFQALHAALEDDRVEALGLIDLLKWNPDTPSVLRRGFLDRRVRQLRRWRDAAASILRTEGESSSSSLAHMLTKLAERGVETIAVGCREHGGYEQFVEAIETERRDLEASGLLELHGLEDTDHIFSPIWAQEWLSELLMSVLERLGADDRKEDPSSLRVGG